MSKVGKQLNNLSTDSAGPSASAWYITAADCFLPGIDGLKKLSRLLLENKNDVLDVGAHLFNSSLSFEALTVLLNSKSSDQLTVVCCAANDAEKQALQQLLFLSSLSSSTYPRVEYICEHEPLSKALDFLNEQAFPDGHNIVLISATGAPKEVDSDDANLFFSYCCLQKSASPVDSAMALLRALDPRDGTGGEKALTRGKDENIPWRAISVAICSESLSVEKLNEIEKHILADADNSQQYTASTSMPLPPGALRISLFTNPSVCLSSTINQITAVICAAIALHQKICPAEQYSPVAETNRALFFRNSSTRPWIHPVSPVEPVQPRRALIIHRSAPGMVLEEVSQGVDADYRSYVEEHDCELFIFEASDKNHLRQKLCRAVEVAQETSLTQSVLSATLAGAATVQRETLTTTECCRVAIVAEDKTDLTQKLLRVIEVLNRGESSEQLADGRSGNAAKGREPGFSASGIYLKVHEANQQNRASEFSPDPDALAFVLPGLGAAYPNMLVDLCFHFPEVRQVFDFVDRLALKSGDQVLPSNLFFPVEKSGSSSNVAMLATMDSAVVSVILAEWALFRLLCDFNVKPDCILGCSTGEFASLAMNGCIEIVEAAAMFYRLSTAVARSVPLSSLANLRSICIASSWHTISTFTESLQEPVYLSAEMSPTYCIVSGFRGAIDELARKLEASKLDFYPLPVAIPYHTPLVAGKVSAEQDEVRQLKMSAPELPTWTCSSGQLLSDNLDELRRWSTALFEKPILFRSTIERMYSAGVRKFIEVGPKGSLVPLISDILQSRPHLAIPVNVPNRSGLAQLLHMLAAVYVAGVDIELNALFRHRRTEVDQQLKAFLIGDISGGDLSHDISEDISLLSVEYKPDESDSEESVDRFFIESSTFTDSQLPQSTQFEEEQAWHNSSAQLPGLAEEAGKSVLHSFMGSMSAFQAEFLASQETVMMEYLASKRSLNIDSYNAAYVVEQSQSHLSQNSCGTPQDYFPEPAYAQNYAFSEPHNDIVHNEFDQSPEFLNPQTSTIATSPWYPGVFRDAGHEPGQECDDDNNAPFVFPFHLDLSEHLFLLDHAIGGCTRASLSKVYLLPLMVALEILAEAAAARFSGLVVTSIENVRAYRRIAVDGDAPLRLAVRAFVSAHGRVTAEIIDYPDTKGPEAQDTKVSTVSKPYVQADIVLSEEYSHAYALIEIPDEIGNSKFNTDELYGVNSMFHGPRMQSVTRLFSAPRFESGVLLSRPAEDWFANVQVPYFCTDPLLLDNASQLVLYAMYEETIPAVALLPFHIDSIEIFASLSNYYGEALNGKARLISLSQRGTQADLEVTTEDDSLLCRINGIHSRAIIISEELRQFVDSPLSYKLSSDISQQLQVPDLHQVCIASIGAASVPDDETALMWLSDYVLHPSEKDLIPARSGVHQRRKEWLLGRIAAKDAIRTLLELTRGIILGAADIAILRDYSGAPVVQIDYERLSLEINVSIAHCDGQAVAMATTLNYRPGIDIERITDREEGFELIAFTSHERQLIRSTNLQVSEAVRMASIWASKEAVAKSSGDGLQRVDHIVASELCLAKTEDKIHGHSIAFNSFDETTSTVYISQLEQFIIAYT